MADREEGTLEVALPDTETDVVQEVDLGTPDDSESEHHMLVRRRRRRGRHGGRRESPTATVPVTNPDEREMTVVELFGLVLPKSSGRLTTGTNMATASATATCFAKPAELVPPSWEAQVAPPYAEGPTGMWHAASWDHQSVGAAFNACPGDASDNHWGYSHPMYYPCQWPCTAQVTHLQSPLSYPSPTQSAIPAECMVSPEVSASAEKTWLYRSAFTLPSADGLVDLSAEDQEQLLRNARPEKYEE